MKRNTFTLIEILGVVAIIAILATLGFAGYSYASTKSKESATQGLITRLNAAFEVAHQKSGFLPPANNFATIEITSDNDVRIDGNTYSSNPGSNRLSRMHAEFTRNFIKTLQMDSMGRFMENNEIVDAWGNTIRYRYPGSLKQGGFDLISAGSDGAFGAGAVSNPTNNISDYREGADWICDDIANF